MLAGLACGPGCHLSRQERPEPAPATAKTEPPAQPATPQAPATAPSQSELEKAIADLEATGKLDAASRDKLLADLRQTDPALWPEYLTVFRSVLEYQHRRKPATNAPLDDPTAVAKSNPAPAQEGETALASDETAAPAAAPGVAPPSRADDLAPEEPGPAASPIQQVAHRKPSEGGTPWRSELDQAIRDLEAQLQAQPDSELATRLGLLRVAADRRDEALRAAPGLAPDVQAYWASQLYALSTFLEARRSTAAPGAEAEAVQHLRQAVAKLSESAPLVVRNPHFCTEVSSYGVFKPFEHYRFLPGQEVLLYAEIENFKSRPAEGGHHTALTAHYRIVDAQGREAAQGDLGRTEETCRNVRRDYFVRYFLALPTHLYDGKYTLQLTVEDVEAKKAAQATIELVIQREKSP